MGLGEDSEGIGRNFKHLGWDLDGFGGFGWGDLVCSLLCRGISTCTATQGFYLHEHT